MEPRGIPLGDTGKPKAVLLSLGGGGAVALGWACVLLLFTLKDDPYGLGLVFAALGFGGVLLGTALSIPALVGAIRGRGRLSSGRAAAGTAACVVAPLVGWTGALAVWGVSGMAGSVFMIWALALAVVGLLAPLPVAAGMRARVRWPVNATAALPGAAVAGLFAFLGDLPDDGLFPLMIGITAAAALPALLALIAAKKDRPRRLVAWLALWLLGAALLMGTMLAGWLVYEVVTGLSRFRL